MLVKPALQATLRVFGLCGSFVVLVWVVLWFLVTCGFWLWSARPIVLMWFLWVGGLALDAESDDCASSCSLWVGGLALDADADADADDCASTWRRSLWICGSFVLPALMRVLLLFVDC